MVLDHWQGGRLPPDLIYLIVKLCSDDRTTLLSCSFVSFVWRQIASRRLFTKLTAIPSLSDKSLEALCLFLDSCSNLHLKVTHLTIAPAGPNESDSDSLEVVPLPILATALAKLPHLLHLHLSRVRVVPWPVYQLSSFPPKPSIQLDSLRLIASAIDYDDPDFPWEALAHLLPLFLAIRHLDLDTVHAVYTQRSPRYTRGLPPIPHRTQVQSLYLSEYTHFGLCTQLSRTILANYLVSLQLGYADSGDVLVRSTYSDAFRVFPHIKRLELFLAARSIISTPLDLQPAPRTIESIHYKFPTLDTDDMTSLNTFNNAWEHVLASLSIVPSTLPLATVSIQATVPRMFLGDRYGNRWIRWDALALCLLKLPALRAVKVDLVVVPQTPPRELVQEFVDYFQHGFDEIHPVFDRERCPAFEIIVS
ncbi:hypothetical protein EIP91_000364 [Steccherinum ochraceum]|uniref:F-box domain-containing protein n=1 Tax=Steccherinum ochraceum TaxID=92696 RepID=A0A4R0RMJ0_9APHY|nr:hypothetical protein EIP91_000364 [Steccherinum ochraceum]